MSKEDLRAITATRALSIDMIEQANSGHPGMPMGAATIGYALFGKEMCFSPKKPQWFNRDRFVLAAGHGSAMLYSLMYLFGYKEMTLEELKKFRQFGSKTPGHPEFMHTKGIDTTSGPLGQGLGIATGFALAEAHLAAKYNKEHFPLIDHYTFALCGDGDLMEGVSSEASSLAAHLGLGKLIVLYDSNDISLDGSTSKAFTENVRARYEAYGWQTLLVEDGNDLTAITKAIQEGKAEETKPTLIEIKTTIGFGSPNKSGSQVSHGAPLGKEEAKLTKRSYGWEEEPFSVPEKVLTHTRAIGAKGDEKAEEWMELFLNYQEKHPQRAEELLRSIEGDIEVEKLVFPTFEEEKKVATRTVSGLVLNALSEQVPALIGGSADLASSNKTMLNKSGDFSSTNYVGKNIWFGVREFGMGTLLNGLELHGGLKSFGATFFVFSDYLRPAIRMSALMQLPVWYIFTHDSIAVGEDGPTHEPIEHLASFRAMPNVQVYRPADAKETIASYKQALKEKGKPTLFVLSRQDLPVLPLPQKCVDEGVAKGGYIVSMLQKESEGILIATGSEVAVALEAQKLLAEKEVFVRVVSLPNTAVFDEQTKAYQELVLPPNEENRLSIECGSSLGWKKYVGNKGGSIAIDTFGASAPAEVLMEKYGFCAKQVAKTYVEKFGK